MKCNLLIKLLFTITILCSCSSKDKSKSKIGKYIFQDDNGIVHIDESCEKLRFGNDVDGHKIYGKIICDTLDFILEDNQRMCTICMNSDAYVQLKNISNRNIERIQSLDTISNENLVVLYSDLVADGVIVTKSYNRFSAYLTSGSNRGYDHRLQVYKALKADGASIPTTYERFSKKYFTPISSCISDTVVNEENLGILYRALKRDCVVIESWNTFKDILSAPGYLGYERRNKIYNALKADNYDVPDTYESFRNTLFYTINKTKIEILYDILKSVNVDVGNEQEFYEWLLRPGKDGFANREYIYDTLKEAKAEIYESYEEFMDWLTSDIPSSSYDYP